MGFNSASLWLRAGTCPGSPGKSRRIGSALGPAHPFPGAILKITMNLDSRELKLDFLVSGLSRSAWDLLMGGKKSD